MRRWSNPQTPPEKRFRGSKYLLKRYSEGFGRLGFRLVKFCQLGQTDVLMYCFFVFFRGGTPPKKLTLRRPSKIGHVTQPPCQRGPDQGRVLSLIELLPFMLLGALKEKGGKAFFMGYEETLDIRNSILQSYRR